MLFNVVSKGDPWPNYRFVYKIIENKMQMQIKCKFVAREKSSLNSDLLKPSMVSNPLKSSFEQISMVFSKDMFK